MNTVFPFSTPHGDKLKALIQSPKLPVEGRRKSREFFAEFLANNPFTTETFTRFLSHIRDLVKDSSEEDVLSKGFF